MAERIHAWTSELRPKDLKNSNLRKKFVLDVLGERIELRHELVV